jgi:LmbE family N-acetylglucosaminyl deacetylase
MEAQLTVHDVASLGTILSVWAHPDDETICCGGIMSLAVQNGHRVVCVTATKGEKGVQDEARWPAERLGDIRAEELRCALECLGIHEHRWLGYTDGELIHVPEAEGVNKLAGIITEVKPQTILTFPPDGVTGHDDHKTISRWVDLAIAQAGSDAVIYHTANTAEAYESYLKPADEKFNFFFNIDQPVLTPEAGCDMCIRLSGEDLERKVKALKLMESQYEVVINEMGEAWTYGAMACEAFCRADKISRK